jgi:hypothetical protein
VAGEADVARQRRVELPDAVLRDDGADPVHHLLALAFWQYAAPQASSGWPCP